MFLLFIAQIFPRAGSYSVTRFYTMFLEAVLFYLIDCIIGGFQQLRRHFETDTLPWIQRLRQKEQELQRRLLKVLFI